MKIVDALAIIFVKISFHFRYLYFDLAGAGDDQTGER